MFVGVGEAHKEVIWQSCINLIFFTTEINALLSLASPELRDGGLICGYVMLGFVHTLPSVKTSGARVAIEKPYHLEVQLHSFSRSPQCLRTCMLANKDVDLKVEIRV